MVTRRASVWRARQQRIDPLVGDLKQWMRADAKAARAIDYILVSVE
jgi:hypothetical protein